MQQQNELGREPGQVVLGAAGPAPALGSGREVLPSLEEVAAAPKPMWKHPAFIVSMILTTLALIAAAVFVILSIMNPGAGEVSRATIDTTSGNAHLTWQASGPVELYVVTNDQAYDITQLVSDENEAWIPSALDLYSRSSCFVVRPADDGTQEVSIDGATLVEQRAAAVCMGDEAAE